MRVKVAFLVFGLLISSLAIAKEEIIISEEVVARDLLLNKTWSCKMLDSLGKGQGFWTFHSIEGEKVFGEISIPQYIACKSDHLRGKIKNNILKYTARTEHSSCVSVNGFLKFYRDSDGLIKAEGLYTYGGTRRRGSYVCQ